MPDCTTAPSFRPYAAESNAPFYTSNSQNSINSEGHPADERILTPAEKMLEARNGGSALIVEDSPEDRFSMVPNEICDARSPYRVGAAALGYWVAIKAKPPTWRFSLAGFISTCAEGKDAVRKGLDELESKGWLLRLRPKSAGGKFSAGALWVLLNDPRNYDSAAAKYEGLGFIRTSKAAPRRRKPAKAVENAVAPIVENSDEQLEDSSAESNQPQQNPRSEPMCGKPDIGSDLGIVENSIAQVPDLRGNAPNVAQNPRSKPMCGKTDIGNSASIKNINKNKNLNSEATQRSDESEGAPGEGRSPKGSLGREAAASLEGKSREEGDSKNGQTSIALPSPSPEAQEAYARIEAFYPRPAEGGARDSAILLLDGLLRRGVKAEDVELAARGYAADCAEKRRPKRYTLSLLTFLREPKGFLLWNPRPESTPSGGGAETPERAAVREAYRRGEASDAALVPAWAEQCSDVRVQSLWSLLSLKLLAEPRLESHDEYEMLRRLAHSRELFPDFAAFAAARLSSG